MNARIAPIALTVGAGAAGLGMTTSVNRSLSRTVAKVSDPSAAVMPTLMFAGYGTVTAASGFIAATEFGKPWGAPMLAAGAGMYIGAFAGQVLGLADWQASTAKA